jgi:hypothetical protein
MLIYVNPYSCAILLATLLKPNLIGPNINASQYESSYSGRQAPKAMVGENMNIFSSQYQCI